MVAHGFSLAPEFGGAKRSQLRRFFSEDDTPQDQGVVPFSVNAQPRTTRPTSRVVWVSSRNLGGVTGVDGNQDIRIDFPSSGASSFVACTGETGSGKSLLLAKAIELLCGGKASKVLGRDHGKKGIVSEMEFFLEEPHCSMIRDICKSNQMSLLEDSEMAQPHQRLHCRRTITLQEAATPGKLRLKSKCEINGHVVTLQLLASVVQSLVAIVDGTKAANALAKLDARISILDTAIPEVVRRDVIKKKQAYCSLRKEREKVQASLDNRSLPKGFSIENEEDAKLLSHWIDELDTFQERVVNLCQSLDGLESKKSGILAICNQLAGSDWMDNASLQKNGFESTVYKLLTNLRDAVRSLEHKLVSAHNALNTLTMLSSQESVLTAIERSRSFINEACESSDAGEDTTILDAAEQCHDLLNSVEEATKRCAQNLEGGLIQSLEAELSVCPVSMEMVDGILLEWASLARKHGVAASTLPSCHQALMAEQSGCDEALDLLDKLVSKEAAAFNDYVAACRDLSQQRQLIADKLTSSVNQRLPNLGMDPTFDVQIDSSRLDASPEKLVSLGADDVHFLKSDPSQTSPHDTKNHVHSVASSGEKARILLAIESSIPGSVALVCMKSGGEGTHAIVPNPHPVLVLYDEIDAHVGGYAATAVAKMLLEQAHNTNHPQQVLAITHNPAVAAVADHHLVVQKVLSAVDGNNTRVRVKSLFASERTQELARMAAGNLAMEEAEAFANALIRDGQTMRNGLVP